MRKYIFSFMVLIVFLFGSLYVSPVFANEEIIPETIEAPIIPEADESEIIEDNSEEEIVSEEETDLETSFTIEENIILKNGCVVEDSTGNTHFFPKTTTAEYLAICALQEALEENIVDDIEFVDFGFGLFVNSINDISLEHTYWQLQLNGGGASVGAAELEVTSGDVVSLVLTQFDPVTFAETPLDSSVTLTIDSLDPVFNNIELPDHCSVTDTAGVVHEFPEDGSPNDFLAVCALAEAKERGIIESFELVYNPDFGLFVQSIDGITPGETEFWALWLNDGFALCGIECLPLTERDIIEFILTNWMKETESTNIFLRIIKTVSSPDEPPSDDEDDPPTGGGGGGGNSTNSFSIPDAVAYLKSMQRGNGSFANSSLYTDWAAVACAAAKVSGEARASLIDYLRSHNKLSSLVTDNERRAIALLALGENPYTFGGTNYIHAIVEEFDGEQFGDADLVNDDIFALIPLEKAGYDEDDELIIKTIEFIISEQSGNGSWVGSVDVTAAGVQALVPFRSVEGVSGALSKASAYLADKQEDDGGWGNVFATSWVMQAESALGESWEKNGKDGLDYLGDMQGDADNNGSVLSGSETEENSIWATSYAIPAALGKPWSKIMKSVGKPKSEASDDEESKEENENTEEEIEEVVETPDETVPPENETIPSPIVENTDTDTTQKVAQVSNENETDDNSADTSTLEEESVAPETLTASVVNSSFPSQNLPLILGISGGALLLLYFIIKFLLPRLR